MGGTGNWEGRPICSVNFWYHGNNSNETVAIWSAFVGSITWIYQLFFPVESGYPQKTSTVESVSKNIRILDTIHCPVNPGSVQPEILANLMKEVNASDSFAPYLFCVCVCILHVCTYIRTYIYICMYMTNTMYKPFHEFHAGILSSK